MFSKLLIATTNLGKVKEITKLLEHLNIEILNLKEFDIEEVEETGETFKDNAELKARYYGQITNLPTLSDDSGLSIKSLNGAPGVKSARYFGKESDYNIILQKLEQAIQESEIKETDAYFTSVVSLYMPQSNEMISFEGKVEGDIIFPARGNNGFGYDPVFIPKGYMQSFAEMLEEEKNKISHRNKAMKQFIDYLICKS